MTTLQRPSARLSLLLAVALALALAVRCLLHPGSDFGGLPVANHAPPPPELAGICPWRQPEQDLRRFFPGASGWVQETLILSGQRMAAAEALGRPLTADENALYLYRIFSGSPGRNPRTLGTIMTQRVKGEFGVIELVVAVRQDGQVQGIRVQRLREPPDTTAILTSSQWLGAFAGKTASGPWRIGTDIPSVRADARRSAGAVVEGVRSLVILLEVARKLGLSQDGADPAPHLLLGS